MIITRPLRRLNVQQLALDTPLPFVVTCAGMGLPWPYGSRQDATRGTGEAPTTMKTAYSDIRDQTVSVEREPSGDKSFSVRHFISQAQFAREANLPTLCVDCGKPIQGNNSWCPACDPFADATVNVDVGTGPR